MPARSISTATISFGLVSIPVKIYTTSEPSHEIHFHLIHEGCGERLKQFYECPRHGKVDRDEMTKGFELTKGNFVELSKQELEALEAVATGEVAMKEFVPATEVDPIYVDRTYYLGPGKGGERAYRLLRDALADAGLVGIASYAARGKQYVVEVRPFENGLAMHQLRYPDEIKAWDEVPLGKLPHPTPSELALARQVIDQLAQDKLDLKPFKDDVKGRVRALVAEKVKGGKIVAPPEVPKPVATDLMAALKASLAQAEPPAARDRGGPPSSGHRKHARTVRARPAAQRAHRARSHARSAARSHR